MSRNSSNPSTFLGTNIEEYEQECPTLGENHLGNKQYYLSGEECCLRCFEKYTNTLLGVECDLCQQALSY